jgi:hypothetical protein
MRKWINRTVYVLVNIPVLAVLTVVLVLLGVYAHFMAEAWPTMRHHWGVIVPAALRRGDKAIDL